MKQTKQAQLTRERNIEIARTLSEAVNDGKIFDDYRKGRVNNKKIRRLSQMQLVHIRDFWMNLPNNFRNHTHYDFKRDVNYTNIINPWPPERRDWGNASEITGLIYFERGKNLFGGKGNQFFPMFLNAYLGIGLTLDLVQPDRVITLATSAVPFGAYAEFFGFPVSVYDIHSEDRKFLDGREMSPQAITHLRGEVPTPSESVLIIDDICVNDKVMSRAMQYFKKRQKSAEGFVNFSHLQDDCNGMKFGKRVLEEKGDPLEKYYTLCMESQWPSRVNYVRGELGCHHSKLIRELRERGIDVAQTTSKLLAKIGY